MSEYVNETFPATRSREIGIHIQLGVVPHP